MTDDTDARTVGAANAGVYGQQALQAMFNLAAPQDNYKALIEQGGFVQPMEGMALSFSRDLSEWHRRIPEYRIKPGHEKLEYPPGSRHVKDLTLTWK
jgi:hypothetical protein